MILERSEGAGVKRECQNWTGIMIDGALVEEPEERCHETAVLRKRCERATRAWGVTGVFC